MKKKMGLMVICLLVFASAVLAMNVIQTQMSSDTNFEASLIRAQVHGEVLTVQIIFKNLSSKERRYTFDFGNVYYTDTKEKKKYLGLKDAGGRFIAGPAYRWIGGGSFSPWLKPQAKSIFWMKFPAPPETTETIDIFIPGIMPFEAVKVAR
jgi:hypothetical protein